MNQIWLKNLARLYLPVYQFETENSRIAYAGYSSIKKSYYTRFILGSVFKHKFIGMKWFWEIPSLPELLGIDIVISEIGQTTLNYFQNLKGLILPEFVLMRINIDRPLDKITRGCISDFPNIIKLIQRHNLTYELLHSDDDFKYFNEKLYLPYISRRHGAEAWIEDLTKIWKGDPKPFLMVIREDGVIVAGTINRRSKDTLSLLRLGLLDGNDEYRRHGVIGAFYYYSIVEGQKMGCKHMDIGATRPFLTDGLTRYKLGLGAEFITECNTWRDYHWIGINKNSEWAKMFLINNPSMHRNKDRKLTLSDLK